MTGYVDLFGRHICSSSCAFVGTRLVGLDLDTLIRRIATYARFWDEVAEAELVEFQKNNPILEWAESGKTLADWEDAQLAIQKLSVGTDLFTSSVSFQDDLGSVYVDFFDWYDPFFKTQLKIHSCSLDYWELNLGWAELAKPLVNVMIDPAGEGEAIIRAMINRASEKTEFNLMTLQSPVDRYIVALKILGFKKPQIHKMCEDAFGDKFSYAKTYVRDRLTKLRQQHPAIKAI